MRLTVVLASVQAGTNCCHSSAHVVSLSSELSDVSPPVSFNLRSTAERFCSTEVATLRDPATSVLFVSFCREVLPSGGVPW